MKPAVLLIDDDQNILHALARALRHQPYRLYTATSAEEALAAVKSRVVDVVVADEQMPGMRGGDLLAWLAEHCPEVMRIVLTGQPTVENAIRAINEGRVYQFFTKPCNPAHLAVAIRKAIELKELQKENRRLSALSSPARGDMSEACRGALDRLRSIIRNEVQMPLESMSRCHPQATTPLATCNPCVADLADRALEGLAAAEHLLDELSSA